MLTTRTLLGLAIDEFGILVAEISTRSDHLEIQRANQFRFEEKLNLINARPLGQKLKQFLRANHFSSKHAFIGIPTKWIIAREIAIPPASKETLSGVLNIQAERAFSFNTNELVFDYCGRTSESEQSDVLLLAAKRETVVMVKELVAGAGLQIRSMTVSALALGTILSDKSQECQFGLYAQPTYCECWTQVNGSPRSIQHFPLTSTDGTDQERIELLTSTIQRFLLLVSQKDLSSPQSITAYDGSGLLDKNVTRLNERLKPQIVVTDGAAQVLSKGASSLDHSEQSQSLAAIAIAMVAARTNKPPIDFVNPRIGIEKKTTNKSITTWASIIGAVCVLFFIFVIFDWQADRRDIITYTKQLELMSEDITAAREIVDRITYATSWTSQKPVFLDFLRELTLTFPEEPTIWATNLRLSEDAGAALVGKAVDEESFYETLDKIKQHKAFFNAQMIHLRNAGRDLREKEFAVNFEFQGEK